jgi:membrane-bound ClpP family serine protease
MYGSVPKHGPGTITGIVIVLFFGLLSLVSGLAILLLGISIYGIALIFLGVIIFMIGVLLSNKILKRHMGYR